MIITDLANYQNGGYHVAIKSDGTKVREKMSDIPPVYPESMDIKITNYCDLHNYCQWCHEGSDLTGKHADMEKLQSVLEGLPKGVELAIGGGNPLTHPNLTGFLYHVKEKGLIANLTINELHVNKYKNLITGLINNNLVKGIGITYSGKKDISWLKQLTPNLVYHVIIGIHDHACLEDMDKALVLGYKTVRKGLDYYSDDVAENMQEWFWNIRKYLGERIVSFDNLAIEQLKIKRLLTNEAWKDFYMGDDGSFTFYLDAVKQKYALSSTSLNRHKFKGTAKEMFKKVRIDYV